MRARALRIVAVAAAALTVACGGASTTTAPLSTLRLGYLANLTHAPALIGLKHGEFQHALGTTNLKAQAFNAGPDEVQAMFGGALDAAFMGPNPAINAFVRSHGAAVRVVAGTAQGGAALVVRPAANIHQAQDLKGKRVATPQLGNTQDVALRAYLAKHGLKTDPQGGGDVKVMPTDNATTLQLFRAGQVDAAWVPEPWASRLVLEAGGEMLVDEATLWPAGRFPTTLLVVTKQLLDTHPQAVAGLIDALISTLDWIAANQVAARDEAGADLARITNKPLAEAVLERAWTHLDFTWDPAAEALNQEAADAHAAGLLDATSLKGILDLGPLNQALAAASKPPVAAAGLG